MPADSESALLSSELHKYTDRRGVREPGIYDYIREVQNIPHILSATIQATRGDELSLIHI